MAFVVGFIGFLATFTSWILLSSEYCNWEPSPKHNAIPLGEGNQTNKLFGYISTAFDDDDEDKLPENDIRYLDIVEGVITPKLKELEEYLNRTM